MELEAMRLPECRRTDVLKVFAKMNVVPKGMTKDELIAELEALVASGKVKPKKE